jgi:hypothetical protein
LRTPGETFGVHARALAATLVAMALGAFAQPAHAVTIDSVAAEGDPVEHHSWPVAVSMTTQDTATLKAAIIRADEQPCPPTASGVIGYYLKGGGDYPAGVVHLLVDTVQLEAGNYFLCVWARPSDPFSDEPPATASQPVHVRRAKVTLELGVPKRPTGRGSRVTVSIRGTVEFPDTLQVDLIPAVGTRRCNERMLSGHNYVLQTLVFSRKLEGSFSFRLSAPLRLFGRRFYACARIGDRVFSRRFSLR